MLIEKRVHFAECRATKRSGLTMENVWHNICIRLHARAHGNNKSHFGIITHVCQIDLVGAVKFLLAAAALRAIVGHYFGGFQK